MMNGSDALCQDRHSSFAPASFAPKFSHEITQVSLPAGPLRVSSEDADPSGLQFRSRLILITTSWRVWVGKLRVHPRVFPFFLLERLRHQCKHVSFTHVLSKPFIPLKQLLGLVLGHFDS